MPGGKKQPKSQAQMRMAYATLHGAKTGMPKSVAREFARGNSGKKMSRLPRRRKSSR